MAFSSASIQKGKKTSLGSYDQEQTRVMGGSQDEWQNPNIDASMDRTHSIIVVHNEHSGSVKEAVNARLRSALGEKKIRKDAVTYLSFYATCPDYSKIGDGGRAAFVSRVRGFLAGKYGEENIVDMRWHFDESTPHLHATIVPITKDGRLCAKEMFAPTKRGMQSWQKDYYEAVAGPLGYDRPQFGKSHEKGYTKETVATREQLRAAESELEHVQSVKNEIEAQIALEAARLECLRQETRELDGEVDAMEAAAAEIERLESAPRREYGEICRGITAVCNQKRARFERGIAALRGRVEGIRRAIERVSERVREPFGLQACADEMKKTQQALERSRENRPSRTQDAR